MHLRISNSTITGVSSRRANDVEEAFQMAKLGRIELKNLITRRYRFDQINEALADLEHGQLRMAVSLWNQDQGSNRPGRFEP